MVFLPETRAAAIFGTDDDVAAFDGVSHERKHAEGPVAVNATVHPDHRRMALGAALHERLEQIGGNIHVADAAAVADFLEVHHTFAGFRVAPVRFGLGLDVALEVVAGCVIVRIRADVELTRARLVDLNGRTGRTVALLRRLLSGGERPHHEDAQEHCVDLLRSSEYISRGSGHGGSGSACGPSERECASESERGARLRWSRNRRATSYGEVSP